MHEVSQRPFPRAITCSQLFSGLVRPGGASSPLPCPAAGSKSMVWLGQSHLPWLLYIGDGG